MSSAAPATSSEPIAADANPDEDHITAYVGRHTFATTLVGGGTGLVAVAGMLGHARLDTVRLYTHPGAAAANEPSISCHMTLIRLHGAIARIWSLPLVRRQAEALPDLQLDDLR